MKKLVTMLMLGIMSISMIGCGEKKSDKEVKTDTKANEDQSAIVLFGPGEPGMRSYIRCYIVEIDVLEN